MSVVLNIEVVNDEGNKYEAIINFDNVITVVAHTVGCRITFINGNSLRCPYSKTRVLAILGEAGLKVVDMLEEA